MTPVNLADKLAQFSSHWDPHVVADYNGNDVMVVKFEGEFPFHMHTDTDDFFLVLDGEMVMDLEGEGVDSTSRDYDIQQHKAEVYQEFEQRLKKVFPEGIKIDRFEFGLSHDNVG